MNLHTDHRGHVQDSEGAVGGAAQVHVPRQGQVPDLTVLPQAGQALRGQQVSGFMIIILTQMNY